MFITPDLGWRRAWSQNQPVIRQHNVDHLSNHQTLCCGWIILCHQPMQPLQYLVMLPIVLYFMLVNKMDADDTEKVKRHCIHIGYPCVATFCRWPISTAMTQKKVHLLTRKSSAGGIMTLITVDITPWSDAIWIQPTIFASIAHDWLRKSVCCVTIYQYPAGKRAFVRTDSIYLRISQGLGFHYPQIKYAQCKTTSPGCILGNTMNGTFHLCQHCRDLSVTPRMPTFHRESFGPTTFKTLYPGVLARNMTKICQH